MIHQNQIYSKYFKKSGNSRFCPERFNCSLLCPYNWPFLFFVSIISWNFWIFYTRFFNGRNIVYQASFWAEIDYFWKLFFLHPYAKCRKLSVKCVPWGFRQLILGAKWQLFLHTIAVLGYCGVAYTEISIFVTVMRNFTIERFIVLCLLLLFDEGVVTESFHFSSFTYQSQTKKSITFFFCMSSCLKMQTMGMISNEISSRIITNFLS